MGWKSRWRGEGPADVLRTGLTIHGIALAEFLPDVVGDLLDDIRIFHLVIQISLKKRLVKTKKKFELDAEGQVVRLVIHGEGRVYMYSDMAM